MSRTYRGRHLPVIPGSARKIQFGVGAFGWRQRRKLIDPIVDELTGIKSDGLRWADPGFYIRFELAEQIDRNTVWPVSDRHPWMWSMGVDTSVKGWYKRRGNRAMRRYNRSVLQAKTIDEDWTGHFMTYDEAFDLWSID
jgi:hypothetical protein